MSSNFFIRRSIGVNLTARYSLYSPGRHNQVSGEQLVSLSSQLYATASQEHVISQNSKTYVGKVGLGKDLVLSQGYNDQSNIKARRMAWIPFTCTYSYYGHLHLTEQIHIQCIHIDMAVRSYSELANLYRIAGNFRWVQTFVVFADRPATGKIRTMKI